MYGKSFKFMTPAINIDIFFYKYPGEKNCQHIKILGSSPI